MTALLNGPGCSQRQAWPPGTVCHSAPGIASCSWRDSETGMRMSCSPGQDQGGRGELRQSACGVVVLDDGHLGEVGGDRLVQVPHPGFELGQFLNQLLKKSTVNAHSVTSRITNGMPRTGAMSAHMANIREQNGPGAA